MMVMGAMKNSNEEDSKRNLGIGWMVQKADSGMVYGEMVFSYSSDVGLQAKSLLFYGWICSGRKEIIDPLLFENIRAKQFNKVKTI